MTRRIEHHNRSEHAADDVYATLVDRDYLVARLRELGGPGAAVLEYSAADGAAAYRIRHGVPAANLPPIVRGFAPADLAVERSETWRRSAPGDYAGTVEAGVRGVPGWIRGTMRLFDLPGGGSELVVDGATRMNVPLLGARLEAVIADNLVWLLDQETAFTLRWMSQGRAPG